MHSSHVPNASSSHSQQLLPCTEPRVTRSMSRLGVGLFSPVPEGKAKCGRCVACAHVVDALSSNRHI